MKGSKKIYTCSECDYQSPRWMGKCPSCGAWNTFTEETFTDVKITSSSAVVKAAVTGEKAVRFSELDIPEYMRVSTGIGEFDRVLGGGLYCFL